MLSSNDVAQMFAQQQNMFMGQSQYAQQIGVSNPNRVKEPWERAAPSAAIRL